MANGVFNIAKGKFAYYAGLPATNDELRIVLLKTSGLEADDTLNNYDDLGALLAAANDEADFTGYSRKVLASVTVTVDDTNNRVDVDAADPSAYTNSGTAQAISKALIVYDSDNTGGTDSNIIPLVYLDCVVTFDTDVAVTISFDPAGFARAS